MSQQMNLGKEERERDREEDKKTLFVVLVRRESERKISPCVNKKRLLGGRQPIKIKLQAIYLRYIL